MGHFTKIRLENFVKTGNPFELLAVIPTFLKEVSEAGRDNPQKSRDKANFKDEAHPINIAMQAMELYRSGQWEKEKALRVVKEALEEYRNPRCGQDWQQKPISLPALPGAKIHVQIEDVELLNQLFQ